MDQGHDRLRCILNWDQLIDTSMSGIELGSHSHTHPEMDAISASAVDEEVRESKEILEHHLKLRVSTFAYPFGYFTPAVSRAVRITASHQHVQ